MIWSISDNDLKTLSSVIGKSISESLKASLSEPQLVANILCNLTNEINSAKFSSFSVEMGGVFVHSQPFVKCSSFPEQEPEYVELGDLLLLRTGVRHGRVVDRRALLLQAKIIQKYPATPDNENQRHLYAKWPSFKYVKSGKLNGQSRHLRGLDLYNAAKYLLLTKNQDCCFMCASNPLIRWLRDYSCIATAQPSNPDLSHYRCFLAELIEFISGNAGKPYNSEPPRQNKSWDRVIEDLIENTAERVSKWIKRASAGKSRTRGQGQMLLFGSFPKLSRLSATPIASTERYDGKGHLTDVPDSWSLDPDIKGGISIVEFTVKHTEQAKQDVG